MNDKLPRVPSQLIELALDDMREAVAKGYRIHLGIWHDGEDCVVCMAGAVMVGTLEGSGGILTPGVMLHRGLASERDVDALTALDRIRQGWFGAAFDMLGLDPFEHRQVVREAERKFGRRLKAGFDSPGSDWFGTMQELADFFRGKGV